jgi:hypothetical protein
VKPDENLGFSDIYYRYKKNEDFERDSSLFTYAYVVGTIGLKSEQKECLMEMRNIHHNICII